VENGSWPTYAMHSVLPPEPGVTASAGEVGTDKSAPLGSGRERERGERPGMLAPTSGVRLSGAAGARARARARLGLMVWLGPKSLFHFSRDFPIAFLFYFL
jgi:hypothetical protein